MSFVSYHTPLGEQISTLSARIIATGVALLMVYVVNFIIIQVNWLTQLFATFVFCRDGPKEDKNLALSRILQTTSVLYLYAVCIIFSVYPPFFQGLASTIVAWVTFAVVVLMHIFCFFATTVAERSLWSYSYTFYHICLIVWFLLIIGFAYTWMGWQ